TAPSSARRPATEDLPEPIPPVSPTLSIAASYGGSGDHVVPSGEPPTCRGRQGGTSPPLRRGRAPQGRAGRVTPPRPEGAAAAAAPAGRGRDGDHRRGRRSRRRDDDLPAAPGAAGGATAQSRRDRAVPGRAERVAARRRPRPGPRPARLGRGGG